MWKDTLFCSYWEQRLVVVLSVLALVLMVSVGVYRRAARSDSVEVTDADTVMFAPLQELKTLVLNANELFWNKSEVWIESEKLYEVLYQMTV